MRNSFLRKVLQGLTRRYGAKAYEVWRETSAEAANLSFVRSVASLEPQCTVHHPFYLRGPEYFQIGSHFFAGPGLRMEAWDYFQGESFTPQIIIGSFVGMNWNVHIGAIRRIEIQDNVLIGSNVLITDHSHGGLIFGEQDVPPAQRPLTSKGPVVIEQNVWIGEGVCILAGVRIGAGAVIGANAVVTRDVAPGEIVGGVPSRPIAHLSRRILDAVPVNKND